MEDAIHQRRVAYERRLGEPLKFLPADSDASRPSHDGIHGSGFAEPLNGISAVSIAHCLLHPEALTHFRKQLHDRAQSGVRLPDAPQYSHIAPLRAFPRDRRYGFAKLRPLPDGPNRCEEFPKDEAAGEGCQRPNGHPVPTPLSRCVPLEPRPGSGQVDGGTT